MSSLPEVAGDAAIYVDPDDPQSLQEAFDRTGTIPATAMIAAGSTRATRFTWVDAAAVFRRLSRRLLRGHS